MLAKEREKHTSAYVLSVRMLFRKSVLAYSAESSPEREGGIQPVSQSDIQTDRQTEGVCAFVCACGVSLARPHVS